MSGIPNKLGFIVKLTHVQTARESHDLNLDFRSFDNGFKQLCVMNFMQECMFILLFGIHVVIISL